MFRDCLKTVKIPRHIVEAIYAQAAQEAPIEACGYLAGKADSVSKHYPMTNIDQSAEHFSLDPTEQFAVIKRVRAEGLEILGVYHSHPETPARPSQEDIRLAYDPTISYVIASLAENQYTIKSFRIADGNVLQEALEVIA